MTQSNLERLLAGLMAWLNQNMAIDPKKPLAESDIAHIGLTPDEFAEIPAPAQHCPWRKMPFKHFNGIEFWQTPYPVPAIRDVAGLRGRIAWRLTSSTAALFKETFRAGKKPGTDLD